MKDISEESVVAKKLLKEIEILNSKPVLNGRDNIYNNLIDLDLIIQTMMMKVERQ